MGADTTDRIADNNGAGFMYLPTVDSTSTNLKLTIATTRICFFATYIYRQPKICSCSWYPRKYISRANLSALDGAYYDIAYTCQNPIAWGLFPSGKFRILLRLFSVCTQADTTRKLLYVCPRRHLTSHWP